MLLTEKFTRSEVKGFLDYLIAECDKYAYCETFEIEYEIKEGYTVFVEMKFTYITSPFSYYYHVMNFYFRDENDSFDLYDEIEVLINESLVLFED